MAFVEGRDVDDPPGPDVPAGSPVSFTYEVTNVGTERLWALDVWHDGVGAADCPQTMLDLGEPARARTHCETAFEKVRVTGFRWAEPGAMRVLARAKAAAGEDGWEELLGESVELCQAQGTAPQLARTRLDLGHLLAGSHRNDEARGQFEQALGLFRELRMNRYVEQVEAAMMAIG